MNKISLISLLTCCVSTSLFARIGETEAQCQNRYGSPVRTIPLEPRELADKCLEFRKAEILLEITFWKGRAVSIVFRHQNQEAFTPIELASLLDAYAGGSQWIVTLDRRPWKVWKRKDGLAAATTNGPTLLMDDVGHSSAAQKHKLQGF